MARRFLRFGAVALVPTATDVALLVWFRLGLGWPLAAANAGAIAAASVLSWLLHRSLTFHADPFVRWVRFPRRFATVAVTAAVVDTAVLLVVHPGGDDAGDLLLAKAVAVAIAAVVRLALYRAVLLGVVRRTMRERQSRPAAPGTARASVVIPAYHEEERIGSTVTALKEGLAHLGSGGAQRVEVVVVDDGSADHTADAALVAGADQVISLPRNRGKGAAVRTGMLAARGRTVAFTDADLSYDAAQVAAAIELVEAGWDVVVGSRRHHEACATGPSRWVREVGSRAVNLLASAVLLSRPHDTQCGLKAFRSDAARLVFGLSRIDGFAFDIEIFHLVERHELALTELPVRVTNRDDSSTVRALRDGVGLLRDLWRIRSFAASGAYERGAARRGWEPPGSLPGVQ